MIESDIVPFRVEIPERELTDLRRRLAETRWPAQVPGVGWDRGVPLDYLQDLAAHWKQRFDWRLWEKRLNEYPQFLTEIDGARVHFLHVRSPHADAMPLLLLHGWPGSVIEFLEVIEPLIDPEDPADAFDLVIPSHPNFGFSGPAPDSGWDTTRIARAYAELMTRLGYPHYAAQGGDFGAAIAPELGRIDADRVLGVHVNAATFGFIPYGGVPEDEAATMTERERTRLAGLERFMAEGSGYFRLQGTRPHTLGFSLADSPAGQLAWIAEKFQEWTGKPGLPEESIARDHMLADISIYWFTNTGSCSAQMYYESLHSGNYPTPSRTPTAVANFAGDVAIRRYAEQVNTIVRWTDYDVGGHFAAMEAPAELVEDIRAFFRDMR